jgi:hypothetical protein
MVLGADAHERSRTIVTVSARTGEVDESAGHGAAQSPIASLSPREPRCRAKEQRNHNPRVGGSSPSSGMRSACTSALCSLDGHAEYIPRVPRFDTLDLAESRGVVRVSLTFRPPARPPAWTQRGRSR